MQYLRMLDRMTLADKMVLDGVRALHAGDAAPEVSRNVSYLAMNGSQGFSLRRDPNRCRARGPGLSGRRLRM